MESQSGWVPVCTMPCSTTVDPKVDYRLHNSDPFRFPAGPPLNLTADTVDNSQRDRWHDDQRSLQRVVLGARCRGRVQQQPEPAKPRRNKKASNQTQGNNFAAGFTILGVSAALSPSESSSARSTRRPRSRPVRLYRSQGRCAWLQLLSKCSRANIGLVARPRSSPSWHGTDTYNHPQRCESATTGDSLPGPTFCTWTCNPSEFDGQSCPNDASGVQGVCVTSLGGTAIGVEYEYGFCFQDCSADGTCPDGEVCQAGQPYAGGGQVMVCVPTTIDPLSETTWQSTTIVAQPQSYGVTTSTYTITFGATNASIAGNASGPFSATFTQTYGASAFKYPGCVEVTTFSGGMWVDEPPTDSDPGTISIANLTSVLSRTKCTMPGDDVSNDENEYVDEITGSGATYTLSGSTMTVSGQGLTPFDDPTTSWTFTKM